MTERTKSILQSTLKFLFAGGLIAWLVQTGKLDVHAVSALFQSGWIFVGLGLLAVNMWIASERWRLLVTPHDVPAGSWEVFKLTLIGVFFNFAMPGGVGGDVVKAYYFGKDHPQAKAAAITSVLLDRILGLYAMVMMAVAVMAFDEERVFHHPTLRALFVFLLVLAVAMTAGFIALFSRRVKQKRWIEIVLHRLPLSAKLLRLYETAHKFGLDRPRILAAFVLSLLAQSIAILFLYVAGIAAGFPDVPLITYFLVAPLGFMATAIPISPAGLGVGQAAFLVLFNLYLGRETTLGPTVMTSQQVVTLLYGLVGAYFYMRRRDRVSTTQIAHTAEEE